MRILFLLFLSLSSFSLAQNIYSFEQAEQELEKNKDFLVVFVYTSWCTVCHLMEETTFKDSSIISYLNQVCYIPLDAESKQTIQFGGNTFKYKSLGNSGIHELATALAKTDQELAFPTLVILNKQFEIIFQHAGYLSEIELTLVLEKTLELSPN
jgi:thioredoxin-related protein